MSSRARGPVTTAAPPPIPMRRVLGGRQADTVDRLATAAAEEVASVGYDRLTIRGIAKRAGVSTATAYTYFASKDHLLTEVFRRRLIGSSQPERLPGRRVATTADRTAGGADARAAAVLGQLAVLVADEPELAAACTIAMFSNEADVRHLRTLIGAELHRRLVTAVGPDTDPTVVGALELAVTGAMVQAGLGHLSYWELPELLARTAELVLGERP